jgi:flagellum-specific ATP synthase
LPKNRYHSGMLTLEDHIKTIMPVNIVGSVVQTQGLTIAAADFPSPVGSIAEIDRPDGKPLTAEVIGFKDDLTILYPIAILPAFGEAIVSTSSKRALAFAVILQWIVLLR